MLGAGSGTRLRPLTRLRPKVLCPVGNVTLLDHSLGRLRAFGLDVAVNAHHHADQIGAATDAHVSVEADEALGTAGGVAHLRDWLDGRGALVVNGDTWTDVPIAPLLDRWDGERVRLLVCGDAVLRAGARVVASLLPPGVVATLPHHPAGLYETCWGPLQEKGGLEVLGGDGRFVACDRPRDYLDANMQASGGAPVIGEGADVRGTLVRAVVWPGAVVAAGEVLVDAVRAPGLTVLVR